MTISALRPFVRPQDDPSVHPNSIDVTNTPQTNIAAFPFRFSAVDATGNHVINTPGVPNYTSNGLWRFSVLDTVGPNIGGIGALNVGGGVAHQIPTGLPVTFGAMINEQAGSGATPYVISSAQATGAGNHNYSLVFVGGILQFQTGAGILTPTTWAAKLGQYYHLTAQIDAGRAVGRIFIDGAQYGPDIPMNAIGAPTGTDNIYFQTVAGGAAGYFAGWMRNAFITDTALTVAQIGTLVNEAYGLNKV